jgi:hypothetical protein
MLEIWGQTPHLSGRLSEKSIEVFAIILFGGIGLSHILQPKAWVKCYILLRDNQEAGAILDGILHLPMAGVIIAFHNVGSGIPVVLTLLGWAILIKCGIRLCLPTQSLRMMARVSLERSAEFQVAGTMLLVFSIVLSYGLYVR